MKKISLFVFVLLITTNIFAQPIAKAPEVKEGEGPYTQLILRGVTIINGTGAPAQGPMDIVIEQNRIVRIASAGYAIRE